MVNACFEPNGFFHCFSIILSSLEIRLFLHMDSNSKYAKQSTSTYSCAYACIYDGKVIMEVRKNAHAIRSLSLLFVQIFLFVFVVKHKQAKRLIANCVYRVCFTSQSHDHAFVYKDTEIKMVQWRHWNSCFIVTRWNAVCRHSHLTYNTINVLLFQR